MTSHNRPQFAEADFRKASFSEPQMSCVEVARRRDWAAMRDDKVAFGTPADHHLTFTSTEFAAFLVGLRAGDFDQR